MDSGVTAMETILVLLHTESDGTLAKVRARDAGPRPGRSGARSSVGLAGADVKAAANSIAACGATRFLGVAGAEFAQSRYATDAAAAEALARAAGATVILAPATSRWNRVTARRGAPPGRPRRHPRHRRWPAEGKLRVTRWYYRQRMEAVIERAQRPWVILVEAGCRAALDRRGGHGVGRDGRR